LHHSYAINIYSLVVIWFSKVECYCAALGGACVPDIHLGLTVKTSVWCKCENFQKMVAKCFEGHPTSYLGLTSGSFAWGWKYSHLHVSRDTLPSFILYSVH
jgi:hypothetical protein